MSCPGRTGQNILFRRRRDNVLVGGDRITFSPAASARSLLIAGTGQEPALRRQRRQHPDRRNNFLRLPTPANLTALDQVMAEWTSAHSYAMRVADLSGTGSGASFAARLNGNTFLTASGVGATVFDNGESDLIVGGAGMDWFFTDLTNSDGDRDTILNQKKKEILTSLS